MYRRERSGMTERAAILQALVDSRMSKSKSTVICCCPWHTVTLLSTDPLSRLKASATLTTSLRLQVLGSMFDIYIQAVAPLQVMLREGSIGKNEWRVS